MNNPQLFWVILGAIALWFGGRWVWRFIQVKRAQSRPFPENWLAIVQRNIGIYPNLPEPLQMELQRRIKNFLVNKEFIGCAGLTVTEEMRVTIAACACLLLLNRPTSEYRKVRWIYLYPSEFIARHTVTDTAGVVSRQSHHLAGEAWSNGRVVLSWDDVRKGVYDFDDGRNVVLHEFAHQLDGESGSTNGAPLLYSKGAYGSWATVMSREFDNLVKHAYFGKKSVLDHYGATNPAEFFAVATETFFEEPAEMAHEHPELFEELKNYYRNDPRDWHQAKEKSDDKNAARKKETPNSESIA